MHSDGIGGRSIHWCGLVLLCVTWGCTEAPVESRFAAQLNIGRLVVAEEDLRINVLPGTRPAVVSVDSNRCVQGSSLGSEAADFRLELRGSAPTPTVIFQTADRPRLQVEVILENVLDGAQFVPVVSVLAAGGTECEVLPDQGELVLGPVPSTSAGDNAVSLCLSLAPCLDMELRTVPPDDLGQAGGEPVRLAVVGEVEANYEVLSQIGERAVELGAHAIVALGNHANSAEATDLERFRESAAAIGLPLVAVLGSEEAAGGVPLPFHDLFGRSDFAFSIGDVGFLVIDTASAELSEAQLAFWRRTLAEMDQELLIAFMHIPPFDPAGFRDRGFNSRTEAAHFITILGEGGVDAVFTGGVGAYETTNYGGIRFYHTGGGGGPIESGSSFDHHFLNVTISPGAETEISVAVEAL